MAATAPPVEKRNETENAANDADNRFLRQSDKGIHAGIIPKCPARYPRAGRRRGPDGCGQQRAVKRHALSAAAGLAEDRNGDVTRHASAKMQNGYGKPPRPARRRRPSRHLKLRRRIRVLRASYNSARSGYPRAGRRRGPYGVRAILP